MKLIVGFGNPGPEYNFTRHNLGFLTLDFYFKLNNLEWEPHEKFNAIWKKVDDKIFIKPQTFYNNIGTSVSSFKIFYKIDNSDILIICDDFNLKFGSSRFRERGSAGGNNGLKSVIENLKTENFPRLRLGTGNDELRKKIGDIDFVLSKFTESEKSAIPAFLKDVCENML